MGWFSRKPTQDKQIEALVKVATNLKMGLWGGMISGVRF
jgi:hypothetical protein